MAFAAGDRLTAQLLNSTFPPSVSDTQDTTGGRTATTYSATLSAGTACGVVFTAPLSGKVVVINSALIENTGTGRSHCTFVINEGGTIGSGTPFTTASDANSIAMQSGDAIDDASLSRAIPITGLTPGDTYNVQQQFRATSGTVTTTYRKLTVLPVI